LIIQPENKTYMNELQVTARLKIHEGKLNEFKYLAAQCLIAVKEREPGAMQYDWFFNDDNTEYVVRERYVDSSAVFAHLGNIGELLGKVLLVADMSLEVFGNPSQELRAAIAAMNPKIYPFYQGL
jgi:quinol monooxygenase YgiN